MITTETHLTERSAESVDGRSSYRHIIIVAAILLSVAGFAFAGTPAATAAPKVVNANLTAILDDPPPPCRPGDKPGPCPYFVNDRTLNQGTMTSDNRNTTPMTPRSSTP